ncbi:MAG TPA: hypothetical protein VMT76_14065 [Puia sp.]|nr:hypothetical protein [Puia sp.]
MKEFLLCYGIIFLALVSCKTKKATHSDKAKTSGITTVMDSIRVDTSAILSLKSLSAAPLHEALSQLWKMDDADQKYWNYLMWDSAEDKRKYPELALYKDFNVTENARCRIRMGKWKVDQKRRELLISFSDGTQEKYVIEKLSLQKMVVSKKIEGTDVEITFIADGLLQKNVENDPFYPDNNLWRIKPTHSETDEQILTRLKQCVHFYSLFFADNHQRAATEISFSGLPNCFEWYNGGIGVPQEPDLDKRWIDCFYSDKEALRGYHLLRTLIEKHVLVWPQHPASWIEETHEILDQVYDKL